MTHLKAINRKASRVEQATAPVSDFAQIVQPSVH